MRFIINLQTTMSVFLEEDLDLEEQSYDKCFELTE